MATRSDDLVLRLQRVVTAHADAAFEAFADAGRLARWWGPKGFTIPSLDFEPRAGSSYRIEMQPPEGEAFALIGDFREVEPPGLLSFTFAWEDPDPDDVETLATLMFRELGESTEISLTQGTFKTAARQALHHDGWSDSFDKLERLIAA
jgi:uncharacterized protein YndB with AHSA1/START domain